MAITIKATQKREREILADWSYPARCISIVDLGTQKAVFNGEEKRQRKIRLSFELPEELRVFSEEKGEQPMVLNKKMTLSMHDKSQLKPFITSWLWAPTKEELKAFDITSVIGKAGIISVGAYTTPEGDTYNTINGITAPMKGMKIADQINPSFEMSLYDGFTWEKFDTLPDFLKEIIEKSQERSDWTLPTKI